jgi:5'-nucleotidase
MSEPILLPRVLLTNDDGVDAPGLKLLAEIAEQFAKEVWIMAPEHDTSGSGQSLSLARPLRVFQRDERVFAVDGTPGDCVALAISHFMAETPPSLVLSGVNPGMNVGDDVNTSGTVGAALTALILGVPAIAVSQARSPKGEPLWDTTRDVLPKVLTHLLSSGWRKETCLSINIPDLPAPEITGFSWARQSQKTIEAYAAKRRVNPKREEYFWIVNDRKTPLAAPNGDIAIMHRGEVAVTPLTLDRSIDIGKPSVLFNGNENHDMETALAVNEG